MAMALLTRCPWASGLSGSKETEADTQTRNPKKKNREEHKPEIPLGRNSAVQNGTAKNGQVVSDRNKRDVYGGASRDRKARYSENRQVIDSSRILQCPESLKDLQCQIIVRRFCELKQMPFRDKADRDETLCDLT
jgi:hypothetical protein